MNDIEQGGWIGKERDDGYSVFRLYGSLKAKNKSESKEYKKNLRKNKTFKNNDGESASTNEQAMGKSFG